MVLGRRARNCRHGRYHRYFFHPNSSLTPPGNVLGLGVGQVLSSLLTPPNATATFRALHTNNTVIVDTLIGNSTNGTGVFPNPSMELMVGFFFVRCFFLTI
jgi:hypothetical protein